MFKAQYEIRKRWCILNGEANGNWVSMALTNGNWVSMALTKKLVEQLNFIGPVELKQVFIDKMERITMYTTSNSLEERIKTKDLAHITWSMGVYTCHLLTNIPAFQDHSSMLF